MFTTTAPLPSAQTIAERMHVFAHSHVARDRQGRSWVTIHNVNEESLIVTERTDEGVDDGSGVITGYRYLRTGDDHESEGQVHTEAAMRFLIIRFLDG